MKRAPKKEAIKYEKRRNKMPFFGFILLVLIGTAFAENDLAVMDIASDSDVIIAHTENQDLNMNKLLPSEDGIISTFVQSVLIILLMLLLLYYMKRLYLQFFAQEIMLQTF